MSFNFEKLGKQLAVIDGGKLGGKIVSIATNEGEQPVKSFIEIPLKDGKYQQIPNPKTEREILYIVGPSGSGKSYYTKEYVTQWKKQHKKGEVFLFSALKEDETLDKLKPAPKRIIIDDRLVSEPIPVEEFKDCCVIFDDCDTISNKAHREAVYHILNNILEVGRHHKITCIVTNHLPTAGKDTRRIINESHSVTYFPQSGSAGQMKRLLIDYLGLENSVLKRIRKSNTRWCTIFKNYPVCIMTERWLFSLNSESDDDSSIDDKE